MFGGFGQERRGTDGLDSSEIVDIQSAVHWLQRSEGFTLLCSITLPTTQAMAGFAALSDLAVCRAATMAARLPTPHGVPRLQDVEGVLRLSKRSEFPLIHLGQWRSPFLELHCLELGEEGDGVVRNMAVLQVACSAMQATVAELLQRV